MIKYAYTGQRLIYNVYIRSYMDVSPFSCVPPPHDFPSMIYSIEDSSSIARGENKRKKKLGDKARLSLVLSPRSRLGEYWRDSDRENGDKSFGRLTKYQYKRGAIRTGRRGQACVKYRHAMVSLYIKIVRSIF